MPNDIDESRVGDSQKNGTVVNLDTYRAARGDVSVTQPIGNVWPMIIAIIALCALLALVRK